ncbi:MAG: hypothetical protein K1X64_02205 [Myxococcaceae bacterium]|nr:hypothetical protein [Myxococcaceae bacterium]
MNHPFVVQSISCIAAVLAACGGTVNPGIDAGHLPDASVDGGTSPDAGTDAGTMSSLPLLPPGHHLGLVTTYETLPTTTGNALNAQLLTAIDAGMAVARLHLAWSELEPTAGTFNWAPLDDALDKVAPSNASLLLLIESVDSEGFSLPADLMNPNDRYGLAQERQLDDAVILARYDALVDAVAVRLAGKPVFAFSVANEPDNYFDDYPPSSTQGQAWLKALAGFMAHARQKIHTAMPFVAVGLTLTQRGLEQNFDLSTLIDSSDVAIFNYYCQRPDFFVDDLNRVPDELNQMLAAAGGRPVLLQELGCPAGPPVGTPSVIGASEAKQAAFFAAVISRMQTEAQLRAAFIFTAVDWSPELTAPYADALRNEGYPALADRFYETLTTWGLLRYADGSARPAWSTFVNGVDALRR